MKYRIQVVSPTGHRTIPPCIFYFKRAAKKYIRKMEVIYPEYKHFIIPNSWAKGKI